MIAHCNGKDDEPATSQRCSGRCVTMFRIVLRVTEPVAILCTVAYFTVQKNAACNFMKRTKDCCEMRPAPVIQSRSSLTLGTGLKLIQATKLDHHGHHPT